MSGAAVSGEAAAARALGLVGTRFRLHGRSADGLDCAGLDCVGLVAAARGITDVPTGYALRGGNFDGVAAVLDARMTRADGERSGDVLLMQSGPGQWHLAIRHAGGIVHADAGARRVVARPGEPPWPVVAVWR